MTAPSAPAPRTGEPDTVEPDTGGPRSGAPGAASIGTPSAAAWSAPATIIGYHASHEQLPPSELLTAVQRAESAGFDAAMCSDHLAPWTRAQGHSGFAWSWLGAALASTDFSLGLVTAPGQRYHPVVVAQAVATLGEMFPGRFWAALGSGEALNEHVTGEPWPDKAHRQRRLRESVDVMRRLLHGELVSLDGAVRVHEARVWSLPRIAPPMIAAAASAPTAAWAAEWADGLITVAAEPETAAEILDAYRGAGGRGGATLQIHLSLADSEHEALSIARDQWGHSGVPSSMVWDIEQPESFEELARPTEENLRQAVIVADSSERLAERIDAVARGFDGVYLHHVGKAQIPFLEKAERELLPMLRERWGRTGGGRP